MIIALHGFLGLPRDWAFFDGVFRDERRREESIYKLNLYNDASPPAESGVSPSSDESPLRAWARTFCERLHAGEGRATSRSERKPVLLGYSMGGRLALHALLERPEMFAGAIIVGAHPGLAAADMRRQRRLNDERWAERFRTEDWDSLTRAWNEQEVFKTAEPVESTIDLVRREKDFDRTRLALAMLQWSLAEQDNLRPALADVSVPTLWLHGAFDRRFAEIYRELRLDLVDSVVHTFAEVPRAGHRAPWDNPPEFARLVQEFLNQVS